MSDRLWKITATYGPDDDPMMWEEASVDEVLAFVRRGVESGTIKGEVVEGVPATECVFPLVNEALLVAPTKERVSYGFDGDGGRYLVIPVSDGGSET